MSMTIALVCEGPDDARIVPALADRLIREAVDWVREQPELVTWRGYESGSRFTSWSTLQRLSIDRNKPQVPRRFGSGLPQREDAPDALKALLLFDELPEDQRPAAVVLQRDDDRTHEGRRDALDLARNNKPWDFAVVVGVAHPVIEAWVLAGFIPDERESPTHTEVCQHLTFVPCQHGHRLSPNHDDHSKQPKAVRKWLTGNHWPRELACLSEAWPTLEANGEHSGLAAFIVEVRDRLIPRAFGTPPP